MRKIILLVSVIAVIAAGWFFYFSGSDEEPPVNVVSVEKRDLSNTLEFSGEVMPQRSYSVMSSVGGAIASVYVSEGSYVEAGDLLLQLDTSVLDIELEKANLSYDLLEQAQASTVMASSAGIEGALAQEKMKIALALSQTTGYDYESFGQAFGADISDGVAKMATSLEGMSMSDVQDFSNSANSFDVSSELEMSKITIKSLKNAIDSMNIVSEMSGRVIALGVNEGEVLAPGMPAMVIADTSNTIISAYVYEKDVSDISEGMDVLINSESRASFGTLSKIGAAAGGVGEMSGFDTMTKIQITPDQKFDRMPGAVVDLEIVVSRKDDVLAIPTDCLTQDNCVFVVNEEGVVQNRAVVIGFVDTYYAEVISGVAKGEVLVVTPKNLVEGQSVKYDRGE